MAQTTRPLTEIGRTGLLQSFGYIYDEILPELRDATRRRKVYRELRDLSPVVGGAFRAIDNILREVPVRVEPGGDAPEDLRAWELVDTAFGEIPWSSVLSQAGSMKEQGWAALEPVYIQRRGEHRDPALTSTYSDGLYGWRKFAPRSQESLERWIFAPGGDDIEALVQRPAPDFHEITIPREKLLLFCLDDDKGSPEGRSLLKNCVLTWKFVKRIQEIEGIGIERDLAGFPLMYAPQEVCASNASGNELAVQNYLKKLVTNIRRNEQEGALLPGVTDSNGQRMYELQLLTSGGQRQFDVDAVIQRYEQRMLLTFLADFLALGTGTAGSYALSQDKTDLFTLSLGGYLDDILEPFNTVEIPRLLRLNGMRARQPMLKRGPVGKRDLGTLGAYLANLSTAGLLLPSADGRLENMLREAAGLPVETEDVAIDGTVGKRAAWVRAVAAIEQGREAA